MIKESRPQPSQALFYPGPPKPSGPSQLSTQQACILLMFISLLFFHVCLSLLLCTLNNLYCYTGGAVGRFIFGPYKAPASHSQAPARPQPSVLQKKSTNEALGPALEGLGPMGLRGPRPFQLSNAGGKRLSLKMVPGKFGGCLEFFFKASLATLI